MLQILYKFIATIFMLTISLCAVAEQRYELEGMTVIGNKESPTPLYIVPWEPTSMPAMVELTLSSEFIDEVMMPVERKVLLRSMKYHNTSDASAE